MQVKSRYHLPSNGSSLIASHRTGSRSHPGQVESCHQSHLVKDGIAMWVNAGHIKYCRSSKQNCRLWVSTLIVSVLTHHL